MVRKTSAGLRLLPKHAGQSRLSACAANGVSQREHVGASESDSGRNYGVRRGIGRISPLMRCSSVPTSAFDAAMVLLKSVV
jgi:hypothetical protein